MKRQIIQTAREWIGTPWQHHQSLKGVGCDCVGFLTGVAREVGINLPRFANYSGVPINDNLKKYLDSFMIKGDRNHLNLADVLLFQFTGLNTHVGLFSPIGVIHACPFEKKVVEVIFDYSLQKRLVGVYSFL
jgi:cell wall-associated NlpC family hydrolase